jgi:GxxExxY protein
MAEIFHKELSYRINGLLFKVHNELGRYCREKQYGDAFEKLLKSENVTFEREKALPVEMIDNTSTNKVDFVVEGKIVLEFKAKPIILKEDYYQTQKYLQASGHKLGLMVNFRNKYLKPIRIIRIHS